MQDDRERQNNLQKPGFGKASLYVFGGAFVAFLAFLVVGMSSHGEAGLGYSVLGIMVGCYTSMLSMLLASIGLLRRERPIWPAITGFSLSVVPALGGIYVDLGAPL